MRSRNPDEPVEVTPEEYERQVLRWLRGSGGEPAGVEVGHLENIAGAGGEYEFDVVVRFTGFGGAEFVVLVECKRHRAPVKRDLVLALHAKLADVGAHKAMMFSTGGFQKGAIEYASEHGMALVVFRDGRASYETRDDGPDRKPPPWVPVYRFEGHSLSISEKGGVDVSVVDDGRFDPIREFLAGT